MSRQNFFDSPLQLDDPDDYFGWGTDTNTVGPPGIGLGGRIYRVTADPNTLTLKDAATLPAGALALQTDGTIWTYDGVTWNAVSGGGGGTGYPMRATLAEVTANASPPGTTATVPLDPAEADANINAAATWGLGEGAPGTAPNLHDVFVSLRGVDITGSDTVTINRNGAGSAISVDIAEQVFAGDVIRIFYAANII